MEIMSNTGNCNTAFQPMNIYSCDENFVSILNQHGGVCLMVLEKISYMTMYVHIFLVCRKDLNAPMKVLT